MGQDEHPVCWRCNGLAHVMTEEGWVRCPVCVGRGRPLGVLPAGAARRTGGSVRR